MLKHPRIGRYLSCRSSGACLASTSARRLQKEAPNSGYRVTESDEHARSVTERRKMEIPPSGTRTASVTNTMLKHPRIGRYSSCRSSG